MKNLSSDQKLRAVKILIDHAPEGFWRKAREAMAEKPRDWSTDLHFSLGLAVRNLLREHGFTDAECPTGNLDDAWASIVEQAAFKAESFVFAEFL